MQTKRTLDRSPGGSQASEAEAGKERSKTDRIHGHIIEISNICELCALLEIATSNHPHPDTADTDSLLLFLSQIPCAFSLLHRWLQHHIAEIDNLN